MPRCSAGLIVFASITCLAGGAVRGADPLSRALATPVTTSWTGIPVRQAAERLTAAGGAAVVVDRRIDPGRLVSLEVAGEPLADVAARVAAAVGGETAVYAGHLRVAPPARAAPLATADVRRARELRSLAPRLRAAVLADAGWSWPDAAVPHDLVAALAAEAGIAIAGLDDLPHDHLPAARLPPLPLADRIDLVLAGFDLRVDWRPRPARPGAPAGFAVVPIGVPDARDPAAAAPRSTGRPPAQRPQAPGAITTFSLSVAAPLDELLATLARRLGLTLDLDRAGLRDAGVAPGEIVRLEIADAPRERLLDAILAPRGLEWRIDDGRLSVSAAPR